uniref:Aminotransferase-like plant mobile domain-containing protein n=1 Tax=Fagus sylvatica TaxID=28930 RepID=A0A2N9I8Z1_FAGSY
MAPGSRGIGAVFVHSSDAKIPIKRGMLIGEPRVPRRSRSHYLSNAPGLADQLVASRKDSAREGGSCAAYFCKVPDSRESELGLVRYGPASRVHRGVFGPFEGSFPIGIPADPDKFLAIREFHVVHGCVLFPMCPGSQINLLRVRKTLCASAAKTRCAQAWQFQSQPSRNFQQNLILPCTEASLGSRDMILANGGRRNVPYAKGLGTLVGLGEQSRSNLGQTSGRIPRSKLGSIPSRNLMSDRGSGSGGHRRSDRLAKGKAVAYAPESSPDTDDEYDAMEDVRTRVDASLARDLQAEFDAEAAGSAPSAARAPPRPGVVIGRSAGPSETTRPSPQPSVTTGSSDAPPAAPRRAHTRSTGILPSRLKRQRSEGIPDSAGTIPEDYVAPGFRYPPHGGIRPRYPVAVEISDTPLLTNLLAHPSSSLVRRCQEPPYSAEAEVGGPSLADSWRVPVRNWSAILGIRFGGRAPPSEPIDGFEAREILGLADRDATEGTRRPSVRIRYLADVLRRDREEPPTELRYRQWAAYFSLLLSYDIASGQPTLSSAAFSGTTGPLFPRPLSSISFLGFWQFTVFWAFEHFPTFAPSRLPLASDPDFPLARRWDTSRIERMTTCTLLELRMTVDCLRDADIIFQPYSAALSQRPEVFRAVALSRLRLWIRTTRSWELLLGERTVRQLGDEAVVPVDPSPLMTIEDYIPRAPSDPYIAGVSAYPSLVREGVPYQEWFEQVSLGSLMSLHEVEGGRVMGGVAMDSHHIRSSGQIERLEGRDGQYADGGDTARGGDGADAEGFGPEPEGLRFSRCRALAALLAVRRLEDQLHGMGITPVTGADLSGPWSAFFFATS